MIKHFTTLFFIGSIFLACEDSNTDYIDCKWFVYAGWQETDPNCSNYRQYVLNDSVGIPGYEYNSSVGFGGGIVNVDNFIHYYKNDNYVELGMKTNHGDGIDYTESVDLQSYYDLGKNLCIDYEKK